MSTPGVGRPSSSGPAPRWEFGSTVIRRASQTVPLALRTQPHAYPHQPDAAPPVKPVAPSGSRTSASARAVVSSRSSRPYSARPPSARATPALDEDQLHERRRTRPYSARQPEPQHMPYTYATHVYTPMSDAESEAAALGLGSGGSRLAEPPHHRASSDPVELHIATSHLLPTAPPAPPSLPSYAHVSSRLRPPDVPREFRSSPAYFAFLSAQEARDEAERAEVEAREMEAMRGRRRGARHTVPQPSFAPTIPLSARFAASTSVPTASPLTAVAQPSRPNAADISTIRLSTALGLHERSLDVFRVLAQLKHQLDLNWEIVRLDEAERRERDEKDRQAWIKEDSARANMEQERIDTGSGQTTMQYIQAGHITVPNTPNVTSTTLALLTAAPAGHSNRARPSSSLSHTAPLVPPMPPAAPTFLTDAEIETHALSNLSAAQRRRIFGGAYADPPDSDDDDAADAFASRRKEAPFDRTRLDDPIEDPPLKKRPPRVGARREPPTDQLPEQIEYTAEMALAFEESVRQWGLFLLQSNDAAPPTGATNADPNADLILVLLDVAAKYNSLMRMAMNPRQPHAEVLLPRMMEAVFKLLMVVLETALVRKAALGESTPTPSNAAAATYMHGPTPSHTAGESDEKESAPTDNGAPSPLQLTSATDAASPGAVVPADTALVPSAAPITGFPTSAGDSFDPTNPEHLSLFQSTLQSYEDSLSTTANGDSSTTRAAVTRDLLAAFATKSHEAQFRDSGLYSVGLLLQRDSLLKSSEKLLRENELLKLNLRDAHRQISWLQEHQEVQIRALAQTSEDTVGIALDQLDDWMEDAIDARKMHLAVVGKVGDMAYDLTNRHAGSVTAEATAEVSHKESMETIRRVHAKEAELMAQRQSEVAAQESAAAAVVEEQAKAFAVLDREVRLMETLTDEEIVEKIASVHDVDTLRGMIHKLLYTKIKRHVHETPSQRAARLRKERTPKMLKSVLIRTAKQTDRLMPLKPLCRVILDIYLSKIAFDDLAQKDPASSSSLVVDAKRRGDSLHGFAYEYFLHRYGLKQMAETNFAELMRSVLVFLHPHKATHMKHAGFVAMNADAMADKNSRVRLAFFARLLNLFTDSPIATDGMEFFLYALKLVHESCVQSVPAAFNQSHAKEAPLDAKGMMRSIEVACVPIVVPVPPQSARATAKRLSLMEPTAQALSRAIAAPSDDADTISLYVPLFLVIESLAHAFKQLGYTDDAMDATLCQIEQLCVYPANSKLNAAPTTDSASRMKLMVKQVIVRQMIRTAGIGNSLAFDKFDTDRSGVVTFDKLRHLIDLDKESASSLSALMDPATGYLGPTGGILMSDFTQSLHADSRLCVSLDTVLELSTLSWLAEHTAITDRYRTSFTAIDTSEFGLISFVEFQRLVNGLDPTRTRQTAMRLFRDGIEEEARLAAAAAANEAVTESKTGKKGKKKSIPLVIPPKPPLTGYGATLQAAKEEAAHAAAATAEESKSEQTVTDTPAAATADSAGSSPTSASAASQRVARVKFADTTASSSGSAAVDAGTASPTHEFLRLDTVIGVLRRNRIGLPSRKPYHEFRAFLRRYRPTVAEDIQKTDAAATGQTTQIEPILASEGITSIPE